MSRLWAEKDIPPSVTIRKAFIHALSVMMLVVLWCYEGLVPKLLFPEAGELDLLRQSGLAGELEGGTNPTRHCRDRVRLIDAALSQESVVVQVADELACDLDAWRMDNRPSVNEGPVQSVNA